MLKSVLLVTVGLILSVKGQADDNGTSEEDYWDLPDDSDRKCSPGQGLNNANRCYDCPAGTYNFEGSLVDVCFVCPLGHFSTESGSTSCHSCTDATGKPSTTKNPGGSSSVDDCVEYDDVIGTFNRATVSLNILVAGKDFCTDIEDMLYELSHVFPFDGHLTKCDVFGLEETEGTMTEMNFKISPPAKIAWQIYEMTHFVHVHVQELNGYVQLGSHFAELLMNLLNEVSAEGGGSEWLGFDMNPDVLQIKDIEVREFSPTFKGICSYLADDEDSFCESGGEDFLPPDFLINFSTADPTQYCNSENSEISKIRNRIEYGEPIFECQRQSNCEVRFVGCVDDESVESTHVTVRIVGAGSQASSLSSDSFDPSSFTVDFGYYANGDRLMGTFNPGEVTNGCLHGEDGPQGLNYGAGEPTCEKCPAGSFINRCSGQCELCPYGTWGDDGIHCNSCGWHFDTPFTGMTSADYCIESSNWWKIDDWDDELRRSTGRTEFQLNLTPTMNMCGAITAKKELDDKCSEMFSTSRLEWPEEGIDQEGWNLERFICSASSQVTEAYSQSCGEDWNSSWDEIFNGLMDGDWDYLLEAACFVGKHVKELEGEDTSSDCTNVDINVVEMSMPAEFQGAMDMMTASLVAPLLDEMENLVNTDFSSLADAAMAMMGNLGMDDVNDLLGWKIGNNVRDIVVAADRGFRVSRFEFSADWNADDFFCENGNAKRDCRNVRECDYSMCRVYERDQDKEIFCKVDECNNCAFSFYAQGEGEEAEEVVPYECASCKDEFRSTIPNGRLRGVYKNNVEASYMCNEGYVPYDCESRAVCDIEGDAEEGRIDYPICVVDQCEYPDMVENGYLWGDWRSDAEKWSKQDWKYMDDYQCPYINFYCNDGYMPEDWNNKVECDVREDYRIREPVCEHEEDDKGEHDDGPCHFPEFISGGYKVYHSDLEGGHQGAWYMCYEPFVMTPNKDMMWGHMNDGADASQAYKDLYNLAFCSEDATSGIAYFPECKHPEEAKHCGLPNYIDHGHAAEFMFKKDLMENGGEYDDNMTEDDGEKVEMDEWMKDKMDKDWDMMDDMMPIAARYECEEGYVMRRTMKDQMGWCRKDGSYEIPYCVPREEYFDVKLQLQNGGDKKMTDKEGRAFGGVVLSMTLDAEGRVLTDWQYGCNDGSNNNAAGAICRTLGFMHGAHIPVSKKMAKSLTEEREFGWTHFSCDYDDTLTHSNHCKGMLYEDAMEEMGMKAKCFGFDMMAVKCFQNAVFNIDINVSFGKKKIMCNAKALKKGNQIDLRPMVEEMDVKFMLDEEEIEEIEVQSNKKGFFSKFDLRKKEFECVTCEIHMGGHLVASGTACKDD